MGSSSFTVNPRWSIVILSMRPDEADVDHPIRVVDPDHQPVLVSRDVEHNAAVSENARMAEVRFQLGR